MKKLSLKVISLFCVFTLIMCYGIFPVKVLGSENNIKLSKAITKENKNYDITLNVKLNDNVKNKNKDIIIALDENNISKEKLTMLKENLLNFTESILQNKTCKVSLVDLNDEANNIDFQSNKDKIKNYINNLSYKENNSTKISFLGLQKQLVNSQKDSEKYVVLFTDLSSDKNYKELINKFNNVTFMNLDVNLNNNFKEEAKKVTSNILNDTITYKNIIVEDEMPNNFEIVSATLNGKSYDPEVLGNKIIWKINKMPSEGLTINYIVKPKEENLSISKLENNAYIEYDKLSYKNGEKINHEKIQFENYMVKNDEKSKEIITKEQVPAAQKTANNFLVKENNQIGNIEIKNELLSSDENKNYKNQFWWSLNSLKNSQVVEGTFEGDSVNIPKLEAGQYSLTVCNPVDYEFVSIKVNGKEISLNKQDQANFKINIDKNNANVKIEIVSKFSPKGYFHSSNATLDKFPLTIISD